VVRLTAAEYEAVRAHPRRFVVAHEHSTTHATVIERHDDYMVVEKLGEAGETAEKLDPRS
jgi:hypothetical protein